MSEEVKNDPKRGIKLKGADKTARIPIKSGSIGTKIEKARMDPRQITGQEIL